MKLKSALTQFLLMTTLLTGAEAAHAITTSLTPIYTQTQLGRLSRNGVPQDWAGDEPFPGIVNATTAYRYATYAVHVGASNYLDIIFDSIPANTFLSAYQTSYKPDSLNTAGRGFETNWLGDAGTSGEYFGSDALFFDIIAAANSTVLFIVNNTGANNLGLNEPFTFNVFAYPDSSFNSDPVELAVTLVPEPSTELLLLAPLALMGARRLRLRTRAASIAAPSDALPA